MHTHSCVENIATELAPAVTAAAELASASSPTVHLSPDLGSQGSLLGLAGGDQLLGS